MSRLALAFAIALAIPVSARAQRPVWVYLRPEAVQSGAIVKGIRERPALENDRAIPASLVKKIARTGAHVRTTSRWLQAVSVDADATEIARLARMKEVRAIVPVAQLSGQAPRTAVRSNLQAAQRADMLADFDSAFYGLLWKGIKMLDVAPSHAIGFTGKGIRIAILDTGFNPTHQSLATRTIVGQKDLINNDANVRDEPGDFTVVGGADQEQHGTWVWSVLGGYAPGTLVGPAFDATFLLAKVDVNQPGNVDFKADEDRWVAAAEWADSMGARVISSSLAYRDFIDSTSYTPAQLNGDITASARAADEAARRGILVVNAMGNFGPARETLWSPADADSIIAVGAVDSLAVVAGFSSRGPTEDGRLKPELSALGVSVPAAAYNTLTGYNAVSGTSLATPFVAGIAAMFMQAWPNLTIMAVRNALLLSGSRASAPDNDVGYGVPDISSAILFPEGLFANGVTSLRVGTNELTTIQPTFTWSGPLVNQQMRPVHYRLEIATDAAFSTIIYSDSTDNTSLTVKQPLRPDTIYWRVVAQAFPNVVRVATAPGNFVEPDWVKLLTLNDTHTVETDSLQPLFRWEPLAADAPSGPLTYDVEILNAQTGSVVQRMRNLSTASIRATDQLTPNVTYTWRVIAHSQIATIADTVPALGNFVVVSTQAPPVTLLYQNFPNPFPRHDLGVTSTAVWFDVNTRTKVALAVYDLRGRLVRQLIPNATACPDVVLDPGQYGRLTETIPCVSTSWDGTDMTGTTVPRGVYILRLRAGGADQVKKILFTP